MKEAGGGMRHLIRTIVFLIPGTCWAWAAIEPADFGGGGASWSRLLVAFGVLALIVRCVEGHHLTDQYVPKVAAFVHRIFWVFVLLEALALYLPGLELSMRDLEWLPGWGLAQILMAVYVSGCKHGESGHPW